MKSGQAPRRIQRGFSVQQVGSETLVYDDCRHRAYCLNESSSVIWRLADGERGIAEICMEASLELQTPVSEEFVVFAMEELRKAGLIEPSQTAGDGSSISRRVMLQRLGVAGALLLPAITSIVAPTAAQAYNGCVDCTSSQAITTAKKRQSAAKRAATPPPSSPQK
jgi:hypothetical protein